MLPERMKKGMVLYKDKTTARRIVRVKRHPEYREERVYVLEGNFGIESEPLEVSELTIQGYVECITVDELNQRFRSGDYLPPQGNCRLGKQIKG